MVKDHFPKFLLFMSSGTPYDGETENPKCRCLSRPPVLEKLRDCISTSDISSRRYGIYGEIID